MDPEDYGLSEELTTLLRKCGDLFEEYNMPDDGWTSKEKEDEYLQFMREAVLQLRVELADIAEVKDEVV